MAQTRSRSSGKYRETEVRALIEEYGAVLNERDTDTRGLRALVAVADLKRAWRHLNADEREVLIMVGVYGFSVRATAELIHKSKSSVDRRYREALAELAWLMNGGIE